MEQKKLLWVIFSTVGFILIIGVVGSLIFLPNSRGIRLVRKDRTEEARESAVEKEFDPIEWVQTDGDYPGIMESEAGGEPSVTEIVIGENGEIESETGAAGHTGVLSKEAAGKEPAVGEKEGLAGPDSKDIEIAVYKAEPETEVTSRPRTAQKPAETAPRTERVREYWIQTGSYSSKFRAEEVKSNLAQKGVASLITTTEVNGDTYYRVRIGPYAGKDEAEKFLDWIKGVSGFESSYVSMVYVQKRVN
jgi:hypothetical protein